MATKTLNTRIQLKYDSYANWTTNNPTLLQGELAIAYLGPTKDNSAVTPNNETHPVLFKVGPGQFNSLPWASALAADVHAWAKAATKPEYKASEIKELDTYIAGKVQDTDLDTRYSFEVTADGKLKVSSTLYTLGVAGATTEVGTYDFVTPSELTEILNNYYTKDEVNTLIQGAKDYADANDANETFTLSYDSENTKIVLTGSDGTNSSIDAKAFIKDGMIESVTLSTDGKSLVITWNTDADKSPQTTTIALSALVDVYTGNTGDYVNVTVSADNVISADLTDSVKTSLGKADTAVQPAALDGYQPKGNYKTIQTAVSEVGAADKTLKISQDTNGVITATPVAIAITASQVSGLANIATTGNVNDLVQTSGDYLIFNCGTSTEVI